MTDIETRAYVEVLLLTLHFMLTSAPAVSNKAAHMTASTLLLAAAYIKAVRPSWYEYNKKIYY